MIRVVPEWVEDVKRNLNAAVIGLGRGYGIPLPLIMDSATIEESLWAIANTMETIYECSSKKPGMFDSPEGFGALRKKNRIRR